MTKKFKVVERQLLNKVIAEQKLSLSGIVDDESAQELGRILGVDAIVSGTITDLLTYLKINSRIVSTETGSVFSVASTEMKKNKTIDELMNREHSTVRQIKKPVLEKNETVGEILLIDDFEREDLGIWQPYLGDWLIVDGMLAQASYDRPAYIVAGDENWSDYVFELKAKKIDGTDGFFILYRFQNSGDLMVWNIGGWWNSRSAHQRYNFKNGLAFDLEGSSSAINVSQGDWHEIKIMVKGGSVKCYYDRRMIIEYTDPEIKKLSCGMIGVGTFGTRAYFDDIKVTALE